MEPLTRTCLLLLSSAVAGGINSIAGGGTLVSFPVAMAVGLSPITANATNALALVPGSLASAWAYRNELKTDRRLALRFVGPSVLGGAIGSLLVLLAPERVYVMVVPGLVLGATLLILFKEQLALLSKSAGARSRSPSAVGLAAPTQQGSALPTGKAAWLSGLAILGMAIYGGYFGAGIGIITLAVLSLLTSLDIHHLNAQKALIASTVNASAATLFVLRGATHLPSAGVMAIGAVLGGYAGARYARRLPVRVVRGLVVTIGLVLSASLLRNAFG